MKRAAKILLLLPLVASAGLAASSGTKRDVGPHYFRVQEAREGQVRVARFHADSPVTPQDFLPVLVAHMHQSCGIAAPELITQEQNLERRQGRDLLVSAEARFRCGDGHPPASQVYQFQRRLCGEYRDSTLLKEACDSFLEWQ